MGEPGAAALIGNSGQVWGWPESCGASHTRSARYTGPIVTAADVRLVCRAVYVAHRLVAISSGPLVILPYESGWHYDTASGRRSAVLPRDNQGTPGRSVHTTCDVGSEEVGRRGGRSHGCSVVLGCARVGVPAKLCPSGSGIHRSGSISGGRGAQPSIANGPRRRRVARGRA